jgi:ribonuclease D
MDSLTNPDTYRVNVNTVWQKIKIRQPAPDQFLYVVQEIAKWREEKAIQENIPRQFVLRDDLIAKIASLSIEQVSYIDQINVHHKVKTGFTKFAKKVLKESYEPNIEVVRPEFPKQLKYSKDCLEMMKLLLKVKASQHKVAERLIATIDSLKMLCAGQENIPVLKGWRKEVFGEDALKMLKGKVGLQIYQRKIEIADIKKGTP